MSDEKGLPTKVIITAFVLVLMIPGLVIEPGPLSEIIGFSVIGGVWGIDLGGDE